MEFFIRKKIESDTYWFAKGYGVIFVDKQENIKPVLDYLIEQDDYWESYKEIVKVIPDFIKGPEISQDDYSRLMWQMEYVGKTDIYEMKSFFEFCRLNDIGVLVFSKTEEY